MEYPRQQSHGIPSPYLYHHQQHTEPISRSTGHLRVPGRSFVLNEEAFGNPEDLLGARVAYRSSESGFAAYPRGSEVLSPDMLRSAGTSGSEGRAAGSGTGNSELSNKMLSRFRAGSTSTKKRKIKTFTSATVSQSCHCCGRTSKTQKMASCSNIRLGTCRKAICRLCFSNNGWDWDAADSPDSTWTCSHCNENCPEFARCFIYEKANLKRKDKTGDTTDSMGTTPHR